MGLKAVSWWATALFTFTHGAEIQFKLDHMKYAVAVVALGCALHLYSVH